MNITLVSCLNKTTCIGICAQHLIDKYFQITVYIILYIIYKISQLKENIFSYRYSVVLGFLKVFSKLFALVITKAKSSGSNRPNIFCHQFCHIISILARTGT